MSQRAIILYDAPKAAGEGMTRWFTDMGWAVTTVPAAHFEEWVEEFPDLRGANLLYIGPDVVRTTYVPNALAAFAKRFTDRGIPVVRGSVDQDGDFKDLLEKTSCGEWGVVGKPSELEDVCRLISNASRA